MPSPTLPQSHAELLERPTFAHLATVRPDGAPQSNVMWFAWDGEVLRMTHRRDRQKFRNLAHDSRVALSIVDPDDPYRFLEVRGEVASIEPDPDATFYLSLQERYDLPIPTHDKDLRVVVTIRPTSYVAVVNGSPVTAG